MSPGGAGAQGTPGNPRREEMGTRDVQRQNTGKQDPAHRLDRKLQAKHERIIRGGGFPEQPVERGCL